MWPLQTPRNQNQKSVSGVTARKRKVEFLACVAQIPVSYFRSLVESRRSVSIDLDPRRGAEVFFSIAT